MSIYVGVDVGRRYIDVMLISTTKAASLRNPITYVGDQYATKVNATIHESIQQGLLALGSSSCDVWGLTLCIPRRDLIVSFGQLYRFFASRYEYAVVEITSREFGTLTAGTEGHPGVALIVSHDLQAIGETRFRSVVHADGHQFHENRGSDWAIGYEGINAALRSYQFTGPKTKLWQRMQRAFKIEYPHEFVSMMDEVQNRLSMYVHFTREVLCLAEEGDAVANKIVWSVVSHYMWLIESTFESLKHQVGRKVVLSGDVFLKSDVLMRRLEAVDSTIHYVPVWRSTVAGAVLRAMRRAYQRHDTLAEDCINLWRKSVDVFERLPFEMVASEIEAVSLDIVERD